MRCVLCGRYFVLVDGSSGIQVYTYEGKAVSAPKWQGMRPELLSRSTVSLANDAVAVVDRAQPKGTFSTRVTVPPHHWIHVYVCVCSGCCLMR